MIAALLWFMVGAFFAGIIAADDYKEKRVTRLSRIADVAEVSMFTLLGPLMFVVLAGYRYAHPRAPKEEG